MVNWLIETWTVPPKRDGAFPVRSDGLASDFACPSKPPDLRSPGVGGWYRQSF
jgi:hypothetical protein